MLHPDFSFEEFLSSGYFLANPSEDKVWVLCGPAQRWHEPSQDTFFYLNDFSLEKETPWLSGSAFFEFSFLHFQEYLKGLSPEIPQFTWGERSQKDYEKQFFCVQNKIKSGLLQKGVPYAVERGSGEIARSHLLFLIQSLFCLENIDHLYLYGFWDLTKQQGCVGASPELFFSQSARAVKTVAVAGTMPHAQQHTEEFHHKIRREHQLVVEAMCTELSSFGKISTAATEQISLPLFSHLKTNIQIALEPEQDFSFESFLKSLHPTGALGALPKKAGRFWLSEIETWAEKRDYFAAPFGVRLGPHFSLCIGMIRGLSWNSGELKLVAGGGVIAESALADEWREICLKLQAIKSNLRLLSI